MLELPYLSVLDCRSRRAKQVFKFVGSFGGTTPPAQRFTLSVAFVGTPNNPYITNFFNKELSEIKKEFTFVKFTSYQDFLSAPKSIQQSLEQNKPYLAVEERVFEVATEVDTATKNVVAYCELKNGRHSRKFPLTDRERIAQFILLQAEPEPELHRANVSTLIAAQKHQVEGGQLPVFFVCTIRKFLQAKKEIPEEPRSVDDPKQRK